MKRSISASWFWLATSALLFVLYFPIVRGEFIYDDLWLVVHNPAIRAITPRLFFTDARTVAQPASGLTHDIYRPLTTLSFALDYHFWNLWPVPYHVENLLLHLLNGFLVAVLLARLNVPRQVVPVGVFAFLFHPVQVQSVAWIAQRSTVLATAFFLGSLICLLSTENIVSDLAGLVLFVLALLAKETTIVLPVIVATWWLSQPSVAGTTSHGRRKVILVVLCLTAIVYLAVRFFVLNQWSEIEGSTMSSGYWMLGVLAFPVYLGKMLAPLALRPSYDFPVFNPILVAGSVFIWLVYATTWIWLFKRRRLPGFALGWIVISLAPVLQIIPIRAFVAERYLYVSMAGLAVAVAWGASRSDWFKNLLWLWIMILVGASWKAIPAWTSENHLWSYAVRQDPANAFAHACLAQSLGDSPLAIEQYQLALVNHPSLGIRYAAYQNLASIYHSSGDEWKAHYWKQLAESHR